MTRALYLITALGIAGLIAVYVVGCNRQDSGRADPTDQTKPAADPAAGHASEASYAPGHEGEHGHEPGEHGGIIVSLGRDSYHAEAVFEKGGRLRLYMFGQDETRVQEVESQELTAYAKAEGGGEAVSFTLKPERQSDDAEGTTSQFVGQLPAEFDGTNVSVTIPNIRIKGERFRMGFTSTSEPHSATDMPDKVSDNEEAQLYLTPGGLYSVADIAANGNQTASQKFEGFRAAHDLKPKTGDKICPVTLTKANPKVSWIVGGKTYEFCCPPCVDEFVALAKESPEEIKQPEDYVKQ